MNLSKRIEALEKHTLVPNISEWYHETCIGGGDVQTTQYLVHSKTGEVSTDPALLEAYEANERRLLQRGQTIDFEVIIGTPAPNEGQGIGQMAETIGQG